ncbi:hypothetical protein Sjap_007311 [Stephania japonica]|uniref:Uncharacterized protein n=1 Tax=Stephania japonica TaxID=461633 RepID=A0AAP0PAB0_9MAGN
MGQEQGGCQDELKLASMNVKFAIIHSWSSLFHVMSMATFTMHLHYLATKLGL